MADFWHKITDAVGDVFGQPASLLDNAAKLTWGNIAPAWDSLTGPGPVVNPLRKGEQPIYMKGDQGYGAYVKNPDGTFSIRNLTQKQSGQFGIPNPYALADTRQAMVAKDVLREDRLKELEATIKLRQPQEVATRAHELAKIGATGEQQRLGIVETAKGNVSLQESKNRGDVAVTNLQVGGQKYVADQQRGSAQYVADRQLEGNNYNAALQYLSNDRTNDVNLALGNRKYDVETYGIDRQFDSAEADRTLAYYTLDRKAQTDRLKTILDLVGSLGNQYQNAVALGARF